MALKQSETRVIKRSQITLNPHNPKNHSEDEVARQKKNLRRVGFLGGVVWNEANGKLIDGHRRIQALDSINKYDGTPETDYEIKVEAVDFDEKTEREQMTYMAVGNSKADYNLIAEYIGDIDYKEAGLSDEDFEAINALLGEGAGDALPEIYDDPFVRERPRRDDGEEESVFDLAHREKTFDEIAEERASASHMTKEQVKAEKQHCQDVATTRHSDMVSYVRIRFADEEQKAVFCELMGVQPTVDVTVLGEDVLNAIQ